MNDLHAWLLQQHHGLRTFHTFQQKLATLSTDQPEQRALCRLLSYLVGSYIDAFDEEPSPVAVADRAYQRLLDLVASLDFRAGAITALPISIVLQHATSGPDRVKRQPAGRRGRPSGAAPGVHKPSYRSVPPFGCPTFTYVQLSRRSWSP
jgi:hypothetical protein